MISDTSAAAMRDKYLFRGQTIYLIPKFFFLQLLWWFGETESAHHLCILDSLLACLPYQRSFRSVGAKELGYRFHDTAPPL